MLLHFPGGIAIAISGLVGGTTIVNAFKVPQTPPATSAPINKAQLSVSLEFFTFPDYTNIPSTTNCLANIQTLRGAPPAVRIGGTTQDRATYDPNLTSAVQYTVPDPTVAPSSLTYGPTYFTLAAGMKGDVTIGFNRQLNNLSNVRAAAIQAKSVMKNLLSVELGNEPDLYSGSSPIVPAGQPWNPTTDGSVEKQWFTDLAPDVGNIFQGGVYLQFPSWSTQGLIPRLGSAINTTVSFSGHSYPQSACGGASTNLPSLMNHTGIKLYTNRYASEAAAAHAAGKQYFLGETNSATCGGGGISPTFGAALWIVDYVIQGALSGVDRMYFHQGTIGNCQYCFWGRFIVGAPYYGVAFVSEFFGTDGVHVAEIDDASDALGVYVVYNAKNYPVRALVYNSAYFDGTGTRSNSTVTLTGIPQSQKKKSSISTETKTTTARAKRLTAQSAISRVDQGGVVTIGGGGTFDNTCKNAGTQSFESVVVDKGTTNVTVRASEALIVYF
ncbi:glycoside hydrolase family 79 protein [Rickenella mellea]|uniref:Glycoside hydrolase family 79 protein n=1 Tax=Rickenella mellea TaxID=50990 RepID=A0A4Y7PV09_9AGAM|nr:glycoside hydrolase family 79 protein [Rickenella mellea]